MGVPFSKRKQGKVSLDFKYKFMYDWYSFVPVPRTAPSKFSCLVSTSRLALFAGSREILADHSGGRGVGGNVNLGFAYYCRERILRREARDEWGKAGNAENKPPCILKTRQRLCTPANCVPWQPSLSRTFGRLRRCELVSFVVRDPTHPS